MTTTISLNNLMSTQQLIEALALPPLEQRRLLAKIGQLVVDRTKQRIKNQTDLDGIVFEPRKKGRKKMLKGLCKLVTVVQLSNARAVVGFASGRTESIAAKQQYGATQTINTSQLPRSDVNGNATRVQAIALIAENFKIHRPNGGRLTPTIKWITENMTIAQAGAILRDMRGRTEHTWQIVVPARKFLGITDKDMQDITQLALDFIKQGD